MSIQRKIQQKRSQRRRREEEEAQALVEQRWSGPGAVEVQGAVFDDSQRMELLATQFLFLGCNPPNNRVMVKDKKCPGCSNPDCSTETLRNHVTYYRVLMKDDESALMAQKGTSDKATCVDCRRQHPISQFPQPSDGTPLFENLSQVGDRCYTLWKASDYLDGMVETLARCSVVEAGTLCWRDPHHKRGEAPRWAVRFEGGVVLPADLAAATCSAKFPIVLDWMTVYRMCPGGKRGSYRKVCCNPAHYTVERLPHLLSIPHPETGDLLDASRLSWPDFAFVQFANLSTNKKIPSPPSSPKPPPPPSTDQEKLESFHLPRTRSPATPPTSSSPQPTFPDFQRRATAKEVARKIGEISLDNGPTTVRGVANKPSGLYSMD